MLKANQHSIANNYINNQATDYLESMSKNNMETQQVQKCW